MSSKGTLSGGRALTQWLQQNATQGSLLQKIINAVNTLADNNASSAIGKIPAPPPPNSINVTTPGGFLQVTVNHSSEIQKGIQYITHIGTDPQFVNPPIIVDHGSSRSPAPFALPVVDHTGTAIKYYVRTLAQYPGSDASSPTIFGSNAPTPVTLNGSTSVLQSGTGSGTGSTSGQQSLVGLGKVQRTASSNAAAGGTPTGGGIPVPPTPPSGLAGGDLSGSYPDPQVVSTHLAGPLPIDQGGTGTGSPSLLPGTNTTVTGSWPDQAVNVTGAPPSGAAGGDLSGTYPNPTVHQVNGAAVPVSQALVGTNSSGQIIPATSAGTVTTVSVATANGFQGTVANPTTTPAISVNVDGTHYLPTTTDQTNWNAKQPAGSYITALTGDVTAAGPGSSAASVVKVNGAAVPASQAYVGTNSSSQIVAASTPSGGAVILITEVVTSGSQASVTFSSIAATYRDLIVRIRGRCTVSGGLVSVVAQFNGDTSSNYHFEDGHIVSTASGFNQATSQSSVLVGYIPGSTATANYSGAADVLLPDYRGTTFFKTCVALSGASLGSGTFTQVVTPSSGQWISTSAINAVKIFFAAAGNFVDGSVVSLYGSL